MRTYRPMPAGCSHCRRSAYGNGVCADFDGVIANTEESNAAYLEKALSAFGIQLTDDERKALIGTNDKARIESLLSRSLVKVTAEDLAGKRRQVGNTYENS